MALHEAALDRAAELVEGLVPSQLDQRTSCTDWDVGALLGHLVAGNRRSAGGRPPLRGPAAGDVLGDDPAAAYRASGEVLKLAWREEGRLDRTYRLPFGELCGRVAITTHLLETVTHGWDLATATGQDPGVDSEAVQVALELARGTMSGEPPPETPFVAAVAAPGDATRLDQLAACLGRRR